MNICAICGKKPITGNSIARRGLAKRKGGVGIKITGITRRRFLPNLQKIRAILPGGSIKTVKVCVSCIQGRKVIKYVHPARSASSPKFL
jgi:large subunit ribosomal protein L28